MKVTEGTPKPVVKPVTIELDGEERVMLARIINTFVWSSLGREHEDFVANLFEELAAGAGGFAGNPKIAGARVNV